MKLPEMLLVKVNVDLKEVSGYGSVTASPYSVEEVSGSRPAALY